MGNFGRHNLHENRPGTFVSEETIFATYHNAGVRVFDIRDQIPPKEIASWVLPMPERMLDPRPRVARNALTCDRLVRPTASSTRRTGTPDCTFWSTRGDGRFLWAYRGPSFRENSFGPELGIDPALGVRLDSGG